MIPRYTSIAPTLFSLALTSLPAAAQEGSSTFGQAHTKRAAELGLLPDPATVVVRDIINYHRHRIGLPKAGRDLALDLRWDAPLPARHRETVLQIGIAAPRVLADKDLRALNLALVIDRSSSMAAHDKMRRVKQALRRFVKRLRPTDRLAIIGYSTVAELLLPSSPVGDRRRALDVIGQLEPGGYTNLHAGLMLGYQEAVKHCEDEANHRVILMTDGLANRGETDARRIAIESKRYNDRGIDLSTIAVGRDLDSKLLGKLARSGRGLFHFVADDADIEKVFVAEAQSLMGIVARELTLEVEHGSGLRVQHVYGYAPQRNECGFSIPLKNFNYGMTEVVLVKFRHECDELRGEEESDTDRRVQVRLRFTAARDGRVETLSDSTQALALRDVGVARGSDHIVRKNFTIAVMARGLHRMASAAKAGRFGDADRALIRAQRFTKKNYPKTSDPEITRNLALLAKYRKILGARIERYRDL